MKKYTLPLLFSASVVAVCHPAFALNGMYSATPPTPDWQQLSENISQMNKTIKTLPTDISTAIKNEFSSLNTFIGPNLAPQGHASSLKYFLTEHWTSVDPSTIPNLASLQQQNTTKISVTPSPYITPQPPLFQKTQKPAISPENLSPDDAASAIAQNETSNNLYNSLSQFVYSMYNNSNGKKYIEDLTPAGTTELSPPTQDSTTTKNPTFEDYMNDNSISRLAMATPASDTLYIADPDGQSKDSYNNNKLMLGPPTTINNAYLNFANLITPTTYSPSQAIAANQFVKYAAQSTQNLTKGFNFKRLFGNPDALNTLETGQDSSYRDFVFKIRSLLAIRSIMINTLNQLIAERTPMKGLAAAIGKEPQEGGTEPRVSPLEVEKYRATHDINDPNWYNTVQNYPPATVQREILITLKEIEQQNYQTHIDNERILAAITAQSLQSNAQQISATQEADSTKVNCAITKATGGKCESSSPSGKATVTDATSSKEINQKP